MVQANRNYSEANLLNDNIWEFGYDQRSQAEAGGEYTKTA
jgi:hypothetical protein